MGSGKPDLPVIAFKSQQDWHAWLTSQRTRSKGLWLKLAKKASGIASVSKQEAIDAALCHGWIDGQLDNFDEKYWLIASRRVNPPANGRRKTAPGSLLKWDACSLRD